MSLDKGASFEREVDACLVIKVHVEEGKKGGDCLSKVMSLHGNPTLQPFGRKNRFKCA